MSDVLTVLHTLLHRVSSMLMPTELNDILQFLRGNQWHRVERANATAPRTGIAYVPDGRAAHHGFMPLAIAADSFISLASGGDRATLQHLFCRHGFERVVSVNLCPSNSGASGAGDVMAGGSGDGDSLRAPPGVKSDSGSGTTAGASAAAAATTVTRRRGRGQRDEEESWVSVDAENTTAGRLACVDAVRGWFGEIEAEAATQSAHDDSLPARRHQRHDDDDDDGHGCETSATRRSAGLSSSVHSLLLVVRCTADNREYATSASASASTSGSVAGARRYAQRADPLFLLLHDLAALQTLYEVRLARFHGTHAHVAVLLLPDDHIYGGILLQQRLRSEVANRFLVRLFQDDDESHAASSSSGSSSGSGSGGGGGGSTARRGGHVDEDAGAVCVLSNRWARAGRLLTLWEPQWAARLPSADSSRDEAVSNGAASSTGGGAAPAVVTDAVLEHFLARRRGDGAFFLRPTNLPFCAFMREALCRYPVLLRPVHLRLLQAAWTSRHALIDVLWALHALLMPFSITTSVSGSGEQGDAGPTESSTADQSPSPSKKRKSKKQKDEVVPSRVRRLYSDVYSDTTLVLDALFEVAATMAASSDAVADAPQAAPKETLATVSLDEAVAFMLLFDELVGQQSGMHVLRADPIRNALVEIYRREMREGAPGPARSPSDSRTASEARVAFLHLLPFHTPSPLCDAGMRSTCRDGSAVRWPVRLPAVMRVSGVRLSVAGALQSAAVTALMPPEASLKEMVEVAGGLRNFVSPHNFYGPLTTDAVRVVNLLALQAVYATSERDKHVPLVQLQQICQLSDEGLLLTLHELQAVGFVVVNAVRQTARCLLAS